MPIIPFTQDNTRVKLPAYREPGVRPWQPGDYTRPDDRAQITKLSQAAPLDFQLQTAGEIYDRAMEGYDRAHGFFKQLFDKTGLTDAAAESRDFYENELYREHPFAAAVGSTLAGEVFDFWRDQVTDPINVATAGMGAAPKVGAGLGVRSGTLHRVAKAAHAAEEARAIDGFIGPSDRIPSQEQVKLAYVKRLREIRAKERARYAEEGRPLPSFEADAPLHMDALEAAADDLRDVRQIEDGYYGSPRDMLAYGGDRVITDGDGGVYGFDNEAFRLALGYNPDLDAPILSVREGHTILDPYGLAYGGTPVKRLPTAGRDMLTSPEFRRQDGALGLFNRKSPPYDLETMVKSEGAQPEDWASLQARLRDVASGGRNDARTWSSGAPLLWRTGDGLQHPLAARRQITPESAYFEPELWPLASKYTRQLRARELEAAEKRAAAAREEAIKAAAEKRKEAMDQEILYEELDYAGRHGYLDEQGNFVPMPVGEVTRAYVDRPTRRFLYRDKTPGSEEAAKAMHLYELYRPVEDLMNPRPPLKRTPEELDAYLGGLVEDIEP